LNRAASLTNPQRLAIQMWATGPHSGSMEVPTAAMIGIGEFDIIGRLNGLDWVLSALHCGFDPYGPHDGTNGLTMRMACPNSLCKGNYHIYTIEVDRSVMPEILTWFIDGNGIIPDYMHRHDNLIVYSKTCRVYFAYSSGYQRRPTSGWLRMRFLK